MKLGLLILAFHLFTCIGLAGWFSRGPKFKVGDCLFRIANPKRPDTRVYLKVLGVGEKQYTVKALLKYPGIEHNIWGEPLNYNFDFIEEDVSDLEKKKIPGTASAKISCDEVPDLEKVKKDLK